MQGLETDISELRHTPLWNLKDSNLNFAEYKRPSFNNVTVMIRIDQEARGSR